MIKIFKAKKIQTIIAWVVALLTTLLVFFRYQAQFTELTDMDIYAEKYAHSQYVLGEGSPQKIDDASLYIYAGFAYARGEDPTTINFEHPPLTKYLLGLSYRLFHNSVVLNLPLFFISLLCVFYLTKTITQNYWLGLVGMVIVGNLQILQEHVSQALMDFPQLTLTLLFFSVLFSKLKFKYLITGLILGGLLAIKYQIPMIFLYLFILLVWAVIEKKLKDWLLALPIMFGVYLLNYLVYFMNGHNLIDFIKFEWFRFRWFTGDRTMPKFLIWQTLFTGSFKAWWAAETYLKEPSWSIFWPMSFITHLFSLAFWQKFDQKILTLVFYATATLIVFSVGSAAYARYLLQLLPFWIIISIWFIQKSYLTLGMFSSKNSA